jgi:hypothetical protein
MSNGNISRRALSAGFASLVPAPTVSAALASGISATDPIFAAIEAHRDAYMRRLKACNVVVHLRDGTPEHEVADEANSIAIAANIAAEVALANIQPTTMAGVLALLAHVDDFDCQGLALPEDPRQCHSLHEFLPTMTDDEILDRFSGEPIELPFTFWILRNARIALQALAVRS